MIYPIVVYGDPILKKKARKIDKTELDVKQLSGDMFETMYKASGVGLAAPQIGKSISLFVIDGEPINEEDMKGFKKVFVNPTIEKRDSGISSFEEGCLSIPGIREYIQRQEKITVHYFDENWHEHKEEFEGLKARIIQHEYDHVEGVLITDHVSTFKKRILRGRLLNITKGGTTTDYKIKLPGRGR